MSHEHTPKGRSSVFLKDLPVSLGGTERSENND